MQSCVSRNVAAALRLVNATMSGRKKPTKATDIDMERSQKQLPSHSTKVHLQERLTAWQLLGGIRKDSVDDGETLITASPEFMNQLPLRRTKAYFQTALTSFRSVLEKQNILSAVVHMDERTPPISPLLLCRLRQTISRQRSHLRQPEIIIGGRPPTMSGCLTVESA